MHNSGRPADNVIAYIEKYIQPVIGDVHAGIHLIEIKQAHAKPRSETEEGHTGQQIESIETRVDWHIRWSVPNFSPDINLFFMKFL